MTDRHSPKPRGAANPKSENGGDALGDLLARVTSNITGRRSLGAEFEQRLAELESAVKEHWRAELTKPITRKNFGLRLRQIRGAFKRAEFSEELRKAGWNLYRFVSKVQMRQKAEYFKACTLAYEIHDNLYIKDEINDWAFRDGEKVYNMLRDRLGGSGAGKALEKTDPKLLREQVLWCVAYANELKRKANTEEALKVFEKLYRFIEDKVSTPEMPCYATLAVLSYQIGSVLRRREDHRAAEIMYMRAIEFYFERSRRRQGELGEFVFSTRRVAMCIGLGVGWVNLTRGYLRRAENAVTTARALMAHIPDPVGRYYVEMLWGTIRRCRAGSDEEELRQAIEALKEARAVFRERNHVRYEAHACKELALAHGRAGEYEESEENLRCLENYSRNSRNEKLLTDVYVIRSRNSRARGDYKGALAQAETAYAAAVSSGNLLPRVDALIARGEAKQGPAGSGRAAQACAGAVKDFEAALTELRPRREGPDGAEHTLNDKIAAVCMLRIAQCHVRNHRWSEANEYLERSKSLRKRVEHKWVDELAARVEREFGRMDRDFSVSANDPTVWNLEDRKKELQRWLTLQALKHEEDSRERAAKLLGITRTRVGQILRESFGKEGAPGDGGEEK